MIIKHGHVPLEWFVSLRYFKARRKRGFLSLISAISILGVAVGVMALIVVLSVMNGFQKDLRERILGTTPHVMIQSFRGSIKNYSELVSKISDLPQVAGASPYIYIQGLITHDTRANGVLVRGIAPELAKKTVRFDSYLIMGTLKDLQNSNPPRIILGSELAKSLGVNVHDYVTLLVPSGRITPLGQLPRSQIFRVSGLFQSGMYQYDQSVAYINLATAQKLTGLKDAVMGIEVRLFDPDTASEVAETLRESLGYEYWIRDWMQMNKNLFSALKLEKTVMFVILTLIIFVAAFNIVSSLIMLVMNKAKDIAILKAMGATSSSIQRTFMLTGFLIGVFGTIMGLFGGFCLCFILKRYHFIELPKDIYYTSTLPVQVEIADVVAVCIAALLISFLATIYPSNQAARTNPVEVLRYE